MSNTAAGNTVILQGVRRIDVAAGIASSDDLMAAAYVAKALRKSKKLSGENDPFREALKNLAAGAKLGTQDNH